MGDRVKATHAETQTIEQKYVHYYTLWASKLRAAEKDLEGYYYYYSFFFLS